MGNRKIGGAIRRLAISRFRIRLPAKRRVLSLRERAFDRAQRATRSLPGRHHRLKPRATRRCAFCTVSPSPRGRPSTGPFARSSEASPPPGLKRPITELEYLIKFVSSRCRRCGDCTLAEVAFLCPQSQCPKFLFNGQCGGSSEGWCEVFPGTRRCIFVRAYDRLRPYGEEGSLKGAYIRPRNWALDQTSSWANYFLGLDHRAQTCDRPPY